MSRLSLKYLAAAALCVAGLGALYAQKAVLFSPDGQLAVHAETQNGALVWRVMRAGKPFMLPSALGLDFIGPGPRPPFAIRRIERREIDTSWQTRFYVRETVRDRAREMTLVCEDAQGLRLDVVMRAYDTAVAFRYAIPRQDRLPGFQLKGETGTWRFAGDVKGWFTQYGGFKTAQEGAFSYRSASSLDTGHLVGMPALVETPQGWAALCEADLTDWAGLFYRLPERPSAAGTTFASALAPLPAVSAASPGVAVIRQTPASSPWRVMAIADTPLALSGVQDVIMNLNPPPESACDFSWVKPGVSSWDWWVDSNNGLSTASTLAYIDFAAEMGWSYHTIDGGWYGWARRPSHGPHVKVAPRPIIDLPRLVAHARAKGVGLVVWLHWKALVENGEAETLAQLARWGIKGVKIDFMERSDQEMVRWCEKVVRLAARERLLVNLHGMYKPTGMNRTWPNQITREGIRGNEMLKFNAQVTPAHTATLPFTRYILGPGDFTPGGFANVFLKDFKPQTARGHRYGDESDLRPIWAEEIGTRAHALALCFAYDSPLMTFCDAPARYRGAAGSAALRNAPTVWKNTWPLAGEVGHSYAVARQSFDNRFYLAALTKESRTLSVPLHFLGPGRHTATLYRDDPARTPQDATALIEETRTVQAGDTLTLPLCDEGGALVVFRP